MYRTLLATVALAFSGVAASADTITVCASGCDYTSINAAVEASNDGDVIQLAAETFVLSATIFCDKRELSIIGATSDSGDIATIIDGNNRKIIRALYASMILENLVLRNGNSGTGGAAAELNADDRLIRIHNCRFENNYTDNSGGAIDISGTNLDIFNCEFFGNVAFTGGAMKIGRGGGTIRDCVFRQNSGNGGAILMSSCQGLEVADCHFIRNHSGSDGGGITLQGSNESAVPNRVVRCTFLGNDAYRGGAVMVRGATNEPTIFEDCIFYGNRSSPLTSGGGTCGGTGAAAINACLQSTFVLDHCVIAKNRCEGVDGLSIGVVRMSFDSLAVVSNSRICGNSPLGFDGPWVDSGGNELGGYCDVCPADLDADGVVDSSDLGLLIAAWGEKGSADLDRDGQVRAGDLGLLIADWGPCQW